MSENREKLQRDKFIKAARELGCDGSEERLNEALKRVAKAPAASGSKAATYHIDRSRGRAKQDEQ